MAQKTGRIIIKLDGTTLQSKQGARLQVGGIQREADISDQGQTFWMERYAPAQVVATLIHTAQTDLEALRDFAGGTVLFECDTGRRYTVPNAFVTELGELTNGEIEVTIAGDPAVQS